MKIVSCIARSSTNDGCGGRWNIIIQPAMDHSVAAHFFSNRLDLFMIILRDAGNTDFCSILKLNDTEIKQTSPMDMERLCLLAGVSCYLKVAVVEDEVAAFLLAMQHGAAYENDNYSWFAARFDSFIYVDRIVVGAKFSGLGIGSLMYKDLFRHARAEDIKSITCEYNIKPPNPASRAFHDKFGFTELGTQWVANGTKQVSLQAADT